jgi:hydroxymethylpyrimidine pyrophosphatase-like HAD family hydrolase
LREQPNVFVMDYDLTIADEGQNYRIRKSVKDKLKNLKSCKLILATGRKFEDIPDKDVLDIFDAIVSENGTILAMDKGKTKKILIGSKWLKTKEKLIKIIEEKGIEFFKGEAILAILKKDEGLVRKSVSEANLSDEVVFEPNKIGVLVLPAGCNKGTGTKAAIEMLGGGQLIAFGDDLNDLTLFDVADVKVAVKNAVPELKARADIVCNKDDGDGVIEVMERICARVMR